MTIRDVIVWRLTGRCDRQDWPASVERSVGPQELLLPIMHDLAGKSGESVAFYVPAGSERLCLLRIESRQALRYPAHRR